MQSLQARLFAIALVLLAAALGLAGLALVNFFEQSVSRFVQRTLMADLDQLATGLEIDKQGAIAMRRPFTDPRFHRAYGGRYWQISEGNRALLRSRSLWDMELKLPHTISVGQVNEQFLLKGPAEQKLLAMATTVIPEIHDANNRDRSANMRRFVLVSAIDYREIETLKGEFGKDVALTLVGLSLLLLLALAAAVFLGLKPLRRLQRHLAAVRAGERQSIAENFPSELNPLVNELNLLLKAQDEAVKMARNRAADLAHGLKTPLSVITIESRLLRKDGHVKYSTEIDRQLAIMRKHVQRDLARARARGIGPAKYERMDATEAVRSLVDVMKRLPRGAGLNWSLDAPDRLVTTVDRIDFNELAGNVLDNARKWGHKKVRVSIAQDSSSFTLAVEDDGPGVPDDGYDKLTERGIRFDPATEGSGVGLSIVHDLATLYKGKVVLEKSDLGGLKVKVVLRLKP